MNVKTLEAIRKKEGSNKNLLSALPTNFYEDCQEALDYAFKSNDYDEFVNLQILIRHISERRVGKLLNYTVYRSNTRRANETITNILPEEEKLLEKFLSDISLFTDNLDVKLNGYLFQEVRR